MDWIHINKLVAMDTQATLHVKIIAKFGTNSPKVRWLLVSMVTHKIEHSLSDNH